MRKLIKKLFRVSHELIEKTISIVASQPSPLLSTLGILLWVGASINIALSFIYVLKQTQLGAFISMTMLVSLFYLIFTSLASNFELRGRGLGKK